MEWEDAITNTVDPEVRAHVYSLVSALGGSGGDEDGRYILGDEALACLKDLRKWLKLYDEKTDRLDVARCLAESNVVKGDLLEILASWPESNAKDKLKLKTALACMELLVPLTWPIEKDDAQMTVNHHRHIPYLRQAQRQYKQAILEHDSQRILRAGVRTALPSIALPTTERTPRDEGIIKLVLYLFRNLALIEAAEKRSIGEDVLLTRSATIESFHQQDVFALILTVSSNMGVDFMTQDTAIIDVLFHVLKGVNVENVFLDKKKLSDKNGKELRALLNQEANMHRSYLKNAPTRHNRFGTMIWVKRDGEGRHSTVSGQDILKDGQSTLKKMDQSKRWNKPKQKSKSDEPANDRFDVPVTLTEPARQYLRSFVEEFLDSGFNPLFNHVRRAIEREADRVLESHKQQYFYLVAWFLEAERVRRRIQKEADQRRKENKIAESFEPDSFGLVSSVLIQEFFVMLNRFMQNALDLKSWRELQAAMRCFTQILLIVQDMSESPLEEDQEIADNIQSRIFYEETTHDRVAAILRGFKDQGLGYLDACTEMTQTFLRMLERYSRENVEMQVRSKRRARKTKRAKAAEQGQDDDEEDQVSEMEDLKDAEQTSKDRRFDFARFAAKFTNQACIDTFVCLTKYYNDLNLEQLKRAHRFFHRVAFKQDLSVMLFRLDILALFHKMVKGPDGLDPKNPMYGEWNELVRQVIKKFVKKMGQRPELAIELLFSKIHATVFYLEYGYEKQTIQSKPKAPAELEVKGALELSEQIAVVVATLSGVSSGSVGHVIWVYETLRSAADERQSWDDEQTARGLDPSSSDKSTDEPSERVMTRGAPPPITVKAPNEEVRVAMFKNARLRLLMSLCGWKCATNDDEPNAIWTIPSDQTAHQLQELQRLVEHNCQEPKMDWADGSTEDQTISPEDLLRRRPTQAPKKAVFDDDSDSDGSDDNNDFLFPAGGPTKMVESRESALQKLKKKRRKRRTSSDQLDDEVRAARRQARADADLERRKGIKSELYVHDSDDQSDDDRDKAFFAEEAANRLGQRAKVQEALRAGRVPAAAEDTLEHRSPRSSRKRHRSLGGDALARKRARKQDSSRDEDIDVSSLELHSSQQSSSASEIASEEETPASSPPPLNAGASIQERVQDKEDAMALSQDADASHKSLSPPVRSKSPIGENDILVPKRRRTRITVFDDGEDE